MTTTVASPDRSTPPAIRNFDRLHIPDPQTVTLHNGVSLLMLDTGQQPVSRLSLVWTGGTADCDSQFRAAASLMPLMLREGAAGRSGAEISEILDFNGAWLHLSATEHHTTLTLFSLNSKLPQVLPLIAEMSQQPDFPEKELRAMAAKQAATIDLNARKVRTVAATLNRRLTLGTDHPLTPPDDAQAVRSVGRSSLISLHRSVMLASPPRVYLGGQLTTDIVQMVEHQLAAMNFTSADLAEPKVVKAQPSASSAILREHVEGSLQAAISYSIPSIPRSHPDYERLRFLVMILGGYFGSRLMQNIREDKGYTYGISAGLVGMLEGSSITITTQCDNRYADAVIAEISKELRRLAEEPISAEELSIARSTLMSTLASTLDGPFPMLDYYVNLDKLAMLRDYFQRQQVAAASLTPSDVSHLARKYFLQPPQLVAVASGNPEARSPEA